MAKLLVCGKLILYTVVTIEEIHYVLNTVAKLKWLELGQNYINHSVKPDKDIANPVRLKNCLFGSEGNAIKSGVLQLCVFCISVDFHCGGSATYGETPPS